MSRTRHARRQRITPAMLEAHGHKCYWCRRVFGTLVERYGRLFPLRAEADHVEPFAYAGELGPTNLVPACHVCNRLKLTRRYADHDMMRAWLAEAWENRGYHAG